MDNWKHRRLVVYITLFASCSMGLGLFFIDRELAAVISQTVGMIVLALIALSTSYSGIAAADDHSKRKND